MGTTEKLRFVCKTMWELLQITILRTNSKIVAIILLENFFSRQTHVKWNLNFDDGHKTAVLHRNQIKR